MIIADYHTHTTFSFDGKCPMELMCKSAHEKGLHEIAFTEHVDAGVNEDYVIKDIKGYHESILAMREKYPDLKIRLGLELAPFGEHKKKADAIEAQLPMDFRLLSCHEAGGIDPYLMECYEGRTRHQAVMLYYESIYRNVKRYESFSSLAHIGYMYRYMKRYGLYGEDERGYLPGDGGDLLDLILKRVIEVGAALEINMSEYKDFGVTMPAIPIIDRYVELGGEIMTYGSDAHKAEDILRNYNDALCILKNAGVKYIATYNQLRQIQHKL